jgi:signal transduction histidine kinase
MTLVVIAGYAGLVELLRELVFKGDTSLASLVATGLIAVAFEPLRRTVQRGLERLLYGDRDDPYAVISRLGDLLGHTVDPREVLPLLTGTIARSLQVPYVAVEIPGDDKRGDKPRPLAEHGAAITTVEAFEMQAHGRTVGRLLVANRGTGTRFSSRERRLLEAVALQAAVAVEVTLLIADLQLSREQLVTAREEERRRLRHDLHDGLGPTLAGMSMQVRAAQKLTSGQERARSILTAIGEDLQRCSAEVRQLVDQLRPPALDAGLEAALRGECQRFDTGGLKVRLRVEGPLEGLGAAVEVAAYRIVAEALTNMARHSGAANCRVAVRRAEELTVEVIDDGAGIDPGARRGLGLDSMRRRASELGGACEFAAMTPHGTAVRVRLPLLAAALESS